jgi:TPP-dependent pyruvate/acetoin dehydrogenase alpha subunit
MHLFDKEARFYGGNAIVGGGLPIALGLALADKMSGRPHVTACFFGEGAAAEGEFHETLNLAALWKLPVLFICENNLYAMGTALSLSESETDLHAKAAAYRIASEAIDGMNVVEVEAAARRSAETIRAGDGPVFLECRTYRFRAHSMFDPQLYRQKEEVEKWMDRDPIERFRKWALTAGEIRQSDVTAIEQAVKDEVEAAVSFAEAGTCEPVEDLLRDVGAERRS